ncbi:transcription factor IIA, alpha/beta subunit-domain-containing protein [Mrakia frigida]|uniref:transcription factor IIA, alpha/beta subunit-domain-containing protein n=1 Tax=Mrakia frigida TaxID=29902 RepID=UPI003FCBF7FA
MSNLIIPKMYRTIIDSVVNSVRLDFDEMAVEEEILALLQQKWETKLVESKVADFEAPQPPSLSAATPSSASLHRQIPPPSLPSGPQHQQETKPSIPSNAYLNGEAQQLSSSRLADEGGRGRVQEEWDGGLKVGGAARGEIVFEGLTLRLRGGAGAEDDDSKSPVAPALTLPATSSPAFPNENELNSDLDEEESSDEDEEDVPLSKRNMILCTFEKVSHQKRKWKASLRAGVAHIDGKDYVFDRCNLEVVLV